MSKSDYTILADRIAVEVFESTLFELSTRIDQLIADCANEGMDLQNLADGIVDHVPGGWTAITAALVGAHKEFSCE